VLVIQSATAEVSTTKSEMTCESTKQKVLPVRTTLLGSQKLSGANKELLYRLESRRTDSHILLSHLKLPEPGVSGPLTHIPRSSVVQLKVKVKVKNQSHVTTDGQSINQYGVESTRL
jgi:hypothetical protein